MIYANRPIRNAAKSANVPFWQIADALSMSEATFTRYLRHELPEQEQEQIFRIIKEIQAKQEGQA